MHRFDFHPRGTQLESRIGFRVGDRGTHSSRTIMLDELSQLAISSHLSGDLKRAILEENVLGKSTSSGRTLTLQRLKELYSFDPVSPIFRTFAGLYHRDPTALPQLALLMAMARDPLLRASARPIVGLASGSELTREAVRNAIGAVVGSRMNEAVLNKVVRNTASSWTKSGHLVGRTIKRRARLHPNTTAFAFALWLAHNAGFGGSDLFQNAWINALDIDPASARNFAERAHAAGLIRFRAIGDGFELDVTPLERLN